MSSDSWKQIPIEKKFKQVVYKIGTIRITFKVNGDFYCIRQEEIDLVKTLI